MLLDGKNFLVQYETEPTMVCVFAGPLVSSSIPHDEHAACYTKQADGTWTLGDGEQVDEAGTQELNDLIDPPIIVTAPTTSATPTPEEVAAVTNVPFAPQF